MTNTNTIESESPFQTGYETPEDTWLPARTHDGEIISGVYDQPVSETCRTRMVEVSEARDTVAMIRSVVKAIPFIGSVVRLSHKQS